MSKEKGEKARNQFLAWAEEMKSQESVDWNPFCYNGKLSPTKIGREIGVGKKSFDKERNEKLYNMLQELQVYLNESGFFHKRNPRLKIDNSNQNERAESEESNVNDSVKMRELKRTNSRLQAENAKLRAELARVEEFKEVLIEMNLWK